MPSRDYCKGPRKTYAAAIRLAATHTPLALLLTALPAAYVVAFAIVYYSQNPHAPLSGAVTSACVTLAAIWLVAALSVWRTAPNALSVAIYLTRAVGNWAAISFLILLSYGFSALPLQYTSIMAIVLTPLLLGLHVAADIFREVRQRLYTILEPPQPPQEIIIQK
jgi:hypothetical protein